MALIVEDGSGLANAESYVSVSDCASYATARGLTFPEAPEAAAEAALRRGAAWLDATYRGRLPGRRKRGRAQGLEWPRTGALDATGEEIGEAEIPAEIIAATCEAAVRELAAPGSLSPDILGTQRAVREKVGDIEVEYADAPAIGDARPIVSVIDGILSSLLAAPTSRHFGGVGRA